MPYTLNPQSVLRAVFCAALGVEFRVWGFGDVSCLRCSGFAQGVPGLVLRVMGENRGLGFPQTLNQLDGWV